MYRTATAGFDASVVRERARLGHQLGRRHDAIDEADAQRVVRRDGIAGEQQLERAPAADEPRQALRSGVAGNQPEVDFGLSELRGVGREAHRAGHRQLAAAAEREPVDGGNHRLAEVLDAGRRSPDRGARARDRRPAIARRAR